MIESIYPVTHHTDHVGLGSTFVVIRGKRHNGIDFIEQALAQGACQIVVQKDNPLSFKMVQLIKESGAQLMYVENARRALAELSARRLEYPARKLKIIGVTGTKGKTTTSCLLAHILHASGHKTALLTTVYNKIENEILPAQLTTAHPDYLHMFFNACVQNNIEYVVMEVAAQALSLDRVYGIEFSGAIFTNFSQEHGEFYPTLHDYFEAKCSLFDQCKDNAPLVVNGDDEWCSQVVHKDSRCFLFGQNTLYDVADASSCPELPGLFNSYNITAACAMASYLGIDEKEYEKACENFSGVPGRMERLNLQHGAVCYIDYAHNPSSYKAVFSTLRPLTNDLIVVFGCGGEKDKVKRPMMGSLAAEYADYIILTSDDPRSEEPADIIKDIRSGIPHTLDDRVVECIDREQAIEIAYKRSRLGSIIVLLGKGPSEHQEVKGVKHPFSERAIVQRLNSAS